MAEHEYKWDLFISYARENLDFVRSKLVEPLRAYKTADGRPVKAFVDVVSLRAGVNWMSEINRAIENCRVFIAVYSDDYFASEACEFELVRGINRDPVSRRKMFCPVAVNAVEGAKVPQEYSHFNWVNAEASGWFDNLIDTLGYRHHGRIHVLNFPAQVGTATIGTPLPPVQVEMLFEGRRVDEIEEIRLLAEAGTLRGTTAVKSQNGLAVFQDLFFDTPVESTRLVATADGCGATFSNPFAVRPAPLITTPKSDPRIEAPGSVFLFGDPEVIGVVRSGLLRIFSLTGQQLGEAATPPKPRMVRRHGRGLVFCGWNGDIVWVGCDGTRREWRPPRKNSISVCGGVAGGSGETLYAGMWSGDVWRLEPDGTCGLEVCHAGGVQTFDVRGSEFFIADLRGNFATYVGGSCVIVEPIEATIRRLKIFEDTAVLIGEEQIYEYAITRRKLFRVRLPISERISSVYGVGEMTVAVSREGRGILFKRSNACGAFWTAVGCVPVSMDGQGRFAVFQRPEGSFALWHDRRLLLQGVTGGLAVSETGRHIAIGEGAGFRVCSMGSILDPPGGGDLEQD